MLNPCNIQVKSPVPVYEETIQTRLIVRPQRLGSRSIAREKNNFGGSFNKIDTPSTNFIDKNPNASE